MKTVVLAWWFFILAGLLVALIVPLGEGFDEPWHLGYVQYLAETGKLPPGPALHLSAELEQFLKLHPIGWGLHTIFPELRTQEEYWQQPGSDRSLDDAKVRALKFSGSYQEGHETFSQQYESHQAPLYYVLASPLFFLTERLFSLSATFLLMRISSVVLASAVVPLSYFLAKRLALSEVAANAVAILVATFPGLYPDVVRISNDALVVPLAAAIFLALANYLESRSRRDCRLLSLALLAGLLTKAFFIPVLAAIAMALLFTRQFRTLLTIALASVGGWLWYARNILVTGSITGLPETVSARTTIGSSLRSLFLIDWIGMFRLAAVSHIWMGNWSLLQYRLWIYKSVMFFFVVGLAGFIVHLRRSSSESIQTLLLIYAVFGASLIYYATQVVQQAGISVIQGWYLSPLIPIEAVVFVVGIEFLFTGRVLVWITAFVTLCFLAMLIYSTAFIEAPYYTGLIEHGPSGSLRAYHPQWADVSVMGERLTRFHPGIPTLTPFILSLAVITMGLFLIGSFVKDRKVFSRIALLILVLPALAAAQTHVVGYTGVLDRLQAERLDLFSFQSGPSSTVSPAFGAGGGTSIWKVHFDGSLVWAVTGEKDVIIGPSRRIEQSTRGRSLMMDAGAGWPLLKLFGFQTIGRGGYGVARIRVPTDIPIEDDRRFWNYGIAGLKSIGSRYLLRIDVRNVHFRGEEIPPTLGRFNIVALVGAGIRW